MNSKKNQPIFNKIQKEFINLLIEDGEIEVEKASIALGVSKATIYNYFNYIKQLSFERKKGKIVLDKKHEKEEKVYADD